MTLRHSLTAALLLPALMLSGCGGEPKAKPTAKPSVDLPTGDVKIPDGVTLTKAGTTLKFAVPDVASVGRIGGEEFAIFLPMADEASAEKTAAAINAATRENGRIVAGKPLGMTVSIGVAMVIPGSSLTLLFKEADETLYLAKHKGRDRYILGRSCAWANPVSLSAVG